MCDSPVVHSALSLSDSVSKCSRNGGSNCNSTTQLNLVDELRSDCSFLEVSCSSDDVGIIGLCKGSNDFYRNRFQLEKDIQKLQKQLQEEMELRTILENAIERNGTKLSSPSCLPQNIPTRRRGNDRQISRPSYTILDGILNAQELLVNVSVLEVTVSKLEQEMVSLHFQLSQERNERRLAEYHLRHSSSQSSSSSRCSKHSIPKMSHSSEGNSCEEVGDESSEATSNRIYSLTEDASSESVAPLHDRKISIAKDTKFCQPLEFGKLTKEMPPKGLWEHPNQLSEEMVRCMKNIFISLADSVMPPKSTLLESHCPSLSPRGHLSNSSLWSLSERSVISSWVQSPQVDLHCSSEVLANENACDPYRVRGKLSWAEIGSYGLATEVSWMSVGKKQLEYAAGALRRFRTLVEQLAKVNPIHLSGNEKLAFWINLYNALIMHAYLAYGVPKSDLKLFSLMQKAAYTVGGHSFSAAAIEYAILKMKPPVHRPQIALLLALHKLKVSEEQRKFAIDAFEPLVAFALSCGMYSSPAVTIYTAKNVEEELYEAQRDFIRASVGMSNKGRLLVPKMLHSFARGFVDDANLAVWISHYLPPHQSAFVEQCMSQRRQSLLGSRNCGILPFDSHFRYLFLPDKVQS